MSGESFNWIIDYYNDSTTASEYTIITDTLPAFTSVNTITHTWNGIADNNNASGTVTADGTTESAEVIDITNNPSITITQNSDGTTTIEMIITNTAAGMNGLR